MIAEREYTLWRPRGALEPNYWRVIEGHVEPQGDNEVIHLSDHGDAGEAVYQMRVALLRIAECEVLDEAKQLARVGATWA